MRLARIAVLAAVASIVALGAAPAPASALSCVDYDDHDWARLRVVYTEEDRDVAVVPFEGGTRGYGCGIGNTHDLREGWLAWTAHPGDGGPTILHVLDLETGARTNLSTWIDDPESIGVDPPFVTLLDRDGDRSWTALRYRVDLGVDAASSHRFAAEGRWASLHGSMLHVLSVDGDDVSLTLRDLAEDRATATGVPTPGDPPWRLLGGDGTWAVLASDLRSERPRPFVGEDARVWVWEIGTDEIVELPPAERDDGGQGRYGTSVDLDGDTLYTEVWQSTLPWSPDDLQARQVPDGPARTVDWNGSLIDGIAADRGMVVTGSWYETPPDDPSATLGELPPPRSTSPVPGPSLVMVAAAVGLAAAAAYRRD